MPQTPLNQKNTTLTLGWVLGELRKDKLINQKQFEHLVYASKRKNNEQHPFTIIENQEWTSSGDITASLDIDYLSHWLAKKVNLDYYRIDPLKVDVASVTASVSQAYANRFHFLPVEVTDKTLTVATAEPFITHWINDLGNVLQLRIKRVVSSPQDIEHFRNEFYHISQSITGANKGDISALSSLGNFEQLVELGKGDEPDANDQHIVRVVDWLLQYAFEQRASDIHLEPRRASSNIRFRIDGVLHTVHEMPPNVIAAVVSRLKAIGRMNVIEKRRPQDGRLKTKLPDGKEVELRLSTMPTAFGEKMVARIFDPDLLIQDFSSMGFSPQIQKDWEKLVSSPHGLILVTGPTGSGKTTTLYSSLKHLARPEINICSIEDPIEMVDEDFNQMHVQHNINLDFASGVRTLLRQDPDIIMVGEIRDKETAETAIQAALTGHLVLSTLHTNDAPSALTRLLELGLPPYQLNASLLGVLAQRLVRTLCPYCKTSGTVDPNQWRTLVTPYDIPIPESINKPVGCNECRQTGYRGRTGIHEFLIVEDNLRELVTHDVNASELRKQAIYDGMLPLRISGALKVAEGLTTIEEIFTVVVDDS